MKAPLPAEVHGPRRDLADFPVLAGSFHKFCSHRERAGAGCLARAHAASTPWSTLRTAGLATAGAGVGLGVLGAILAVLEGSQASVLLAHCHLEDGMRLCDAAGRDATDSAFALMHGSRLSLALGGVAIAGGIGMFFLAEDTPPPKGASGSGVRIQLVHLPGQQGCSLAIQGRF